MAPCPLSVIILTYNEEINLPGALDSITNWAEHVFVVDSFSTDATLEIATNYRIPIYQNAWVDWATQRNWALTNLPLKNEWVLFLDADERVTRELAEEIRRVLTKLPRDVNGFYIRRKFIFLRKWLKHGGFHPNWVLRLVKKDYTTILPAGDSEYFVVKGKTSRLSSFMMHEHANELSFFVNKHNKISELAARKLLTDIKILSNEDKKNTEVEGKWRIWLKENILFRFPLFLRPFFLFTYRYLWRLGCLDGIEGLIYYFLHDFWYPFLIDAKAFEIKMKRGSQESLK